MHRLTWDEVPAHVRAAIEAELGASVVRADGVEGGFSPCLASTLTLDDGRTVFAKSVSAEQNPDSPQYVRRELETVAALPAELPVPKLLAVIDDGDWVTGVFEHVDGRLPLTPWHPDELAAALAALQRLGEVRAPSALPTAADRLRPLFDGWEKLRADDVVPPPWHDRVDALVDLERAALDAVAGDRLVHNDIRADNLLVTPAGEVVIVDWAHACRGAPWLDTVLWRPALQLEGGPRPDEVLAEATRPTHEQLVAVVAGCAGYFVERGRLADPPGLPTLREFQRVQGEITLAWLGRLLDLDLVPSPS